MSPATIPLLMMLVVTSMSPAALASEGGRRPSSIDVFVTSDVDVSGRMASVDIHVVDGLAALERELSDGLPGDPGKAQRQALQRINLLGEELRSRVESAAGGLVLAQKFGIKKVPAIVFEGGGSVIYGVTDVRQAVEIYQQWVIR